MTVTTVAKITGVGISTGAGTSFDTLLQQNGAVFNGITDDSAAIQSAINVYSSTKRGQIVFPAGLSAKINSGLTITSGVIGIDFNGCLIDASGMSSGTAISIVSNQSSPYAQYCPVMPLKNFFLLGPDTDGGTVDGISVLGTTPSQVASQAFDNFVIQGFRDNFVVGSLAYLLMLRGFQLTHAHRRSFSVVGTTTSGEGLALIQGVIGNCTNATNDAVGLYVDPNANAPDLLLFGVAHDYSNVAFDIGAGKTQLVANHFENSSASPMGYISCKAAGQGGNGFPTHVQINGGSLRHGGISQANPEGASGRAVMFQLTDITGTNQCQLDIDGLQWKNNGRYSTELVNVNATNSNPTVRHRVAWESHPGTNGRLCGYTNALHNGGFEISGSTFFPGATGYPQIATAANPPVLVTVAATGSDGWGFSGTGTVTRDTSVFRSGAASFKIVGTGQNGIAYSASMRVRPGDKFMQRGYLNVTAFTAGSLRFKLYFFNELGVEISETSATPLVTATTSGFVQVDNIYSVPAGAETARAGIQWVSFNGTGYADDIECWVF